MMKKKFLVLILIVIFVTNMLGGCGAEEIELNNEALVNNSDDEFE